MFPFDNWSTCDPFTGQPDGNFDILYGPVTLTTRHTGPFRVGDLDGWFQRVDRGDTVAQRPAGHGQVRGAAYYGSRAVTIAGHIFTTPENGESTLWETVEELNGVASGVLQVESDVGGVPTEADVVTASLRWTPISADVATYTLVLTADSPERGSSDRVALTTGSGTALRNVGPVRSGPLIEWEGAATNPGISWPGGSWRLGQNIGSGDRLRVNFLTGHVHLNDARILPAWTGSWLSLAPGQQVNVTALGRSATARRVSAWN